MLLPIFGGGEPGGGFKNFNKMGKRVVAAKEGDLQYAFFGLYQKMLCHFHAGVIHVLAEGLARFLAKEGREIGGGQVAELGDFRQGNVLGYVGHDVNNSPFDGGVEVVMLAFHHGAALQDFHENSIEEKLGHQTDVGLLAVGGINNFHAVDQLPQGSGDIPHHPRGGGELLNEAGIHSIGGKGEHDGAGAGTFFGANGMNILGREEKEHTVAQGKVHAVEDAGTLAVLIKDDFIVVVPMGVEAGVAVLTVAPDIFISEIGTR